MQVEIIIKHVGFGQVKLYFESAEGLPIGASFIRENPKLELLKYGRDYLIWRNREGILVAISKVGTNNYNSYRLSEEPLKSFLVKEAKSET